MTNSPPFSSPLDARQDREEENETVFSLKRYYMRQRIVRDEAPMEEDAGDNDWTVTYTDMVTLMMAFFVFITAMSFLEPHIENHKYDNPDRTPVQISPFDGMGFTPATAGNPANRDPVNSRFDDPEAQASTTDPSPSGEVNTGTEAGQAPVVEPAPPVTSPATETAAAPSDEAQAPLARQLEQLVVDNNLAGQVDVIRGQETVTLRISERILFASGRANLETDGRALVGRLATILNQSGGVISIEGHTDNRPIKTSQFASNWELSAGRATEVLRQLVSMGLPANRLRAVAYAETRPLADNESTEGRSQNRRVELVISTQP